MVTYVFDSCIGIPAFWSVESAIAIFVEEFWNDKVSVSNNAITIEIEADIRHLRSSTVSSEVGQSTIGVRFLASLPPVRDLGFFTVCDRSFPYVFQSHLLVETFMIKTEGLVHASIEWLCHSLASCIAEDVLWCGLEGLGPSKSVWRRISLNSGFNHLLFNKYIFLYFIFSFSFLNL